MSPVFGALRWQQKSQGSDLDPLLESNLLSMGESVNRLLRGEFSNPKAQLPQQQPTRPTTAPGEVAGKVAFQSAALGCLSAHGPMWQGLLGALEDSDMTMQEALMSLESQLAFRDGLNHAQPPAPSSHASRAISWHNDPSPPPLV